MGYRRGFKTEANGLATEIRVELGLNGLDRLDPATLATHLDIPLLRLSQLADEAPLSKHLLNSEKEAFSALTVFYGSERAIVHNDRHAPSRQNSNLAHELSHGLLLHPPTPPLDDMGCRDWNQDIEDEATWLAGILLVTEEAALHIAMGHWSKPDAADVLGVSPKMIQFRLNATGAVKRVRRRRR